MKKLAGILVLILLLTSVTSCSTSGSGDNTNNSEAAVSSVTTAPEMPSESPSFNNKQTDEPENTGAPEVEAAQPTPEQPAYPLTDILDTLSFFATAPSGPPIVESSWANLQVFADAEELTNVHIDWVESSFQTSAEYLPILIASGDYPDLISGINRFYIGGLSSAFAQGVIIDLADYTEDYMPNYSGYAHKEDIIRNVLTDGGNELAICEISDMLDVQAGIFVRKDWLDELNMDMPATIDEITNILDAFKVNYGCTEAISMKATKAYTDGAALTSPYGITGYTIGDSGLDHFFIDDDGNVNSSLCSDGLRDYLQLLNKWYQNGYYSFEALFSGSAFNNESNVGTGVTGVFGDTATSLTTYYSFAEDESFQLAPVGALSLTTGETAINHFYKAYIVSTSTAVSVSDNCKNTELAMRWMDYWYSEDGLLAMNYGPQGVTWEYDNDGNVKYTSLITEDPDWSPSTLIMKYYFKNRIFGLALQDSNRDYYTELQAEAVDLFRSTSDNSRRLPSDYLYPSDIEAETYSEIYSDIATYTDTMILQFIVGETPFSEWDNYQSMLKQMGIDQCVEIYQAAYDRYLNRFG